MADTVVLQVERRISMHFRSKLLMFSFCQSKKNKTLRVPIIGQKNILADHHLKEQSYQILDFMLDSIKLNEYRYVFSEGQFMVLQHFSKVLPIGGHR